LVRVKSLAPRGSAARSVGPRWFALRRRRFGLPRRAREALGGTLAAEVRRGGRKVGAVFFRARFRSRRRGRTREGGGSGAAATGGGGGGGSRAAGRRNRRRTRKTSQRQRSTTAATKDEALAGLFEDGLQWSLPWSGKDEEVPHFFFFVEGPAARRARRAACTKSANEGGGGAGLRPSGEF